MEFYGCILLILMVSSRVLADPCTEYTPISDIHRRGAEYQLSEGELPINDRELVEGVWYGYRSFKLLDKAPGTCRCGGLFPLWRNGTTDDTSTICMQTSSGSCSDTFQIEMKTCNGSEVYSLLKPAVRRASYCFVNTQDDPIQD